MSTDERPERRHGERMLRRETNRFEGRRKRARPEPPAAAPANPDPVADEARQQLATQVARAALNVVKGAAIVERQRELVFDLRRNGHDTAAAEALLRSFHEVLLELRKHLAKLEHQLRRGVT